MKMSICHICLRTDREVQKVNQKLSDFLDDLCDFVTIYSAKYCAECTQMLKKCYKFREKCTTAVKILKKWKKLKPSERTPINLLYTKLPQSQLSLCNIQNCKVYSYQETVPPITQPTTTPYMVIDPSNLQPIVSNSHSNTINPLPSPAKTPYIVIDPTKPVLHASCNINKHETNDESVKSKSENGQDCDKDVKYNGTAVQNDSDNDSCVTNVEYLDEDILSNDDRSEVNDDPPQKEYIEFAESEDNDETPQKEYLEIDLSNDAEYLDIDNDEMEYDVDLISDTEKKTKSFMADNVNNKMQKILSDVANENNIDEDATANNNVTRTDMNSNEEIIRNKRTKRDVNDHDYIATMNENATLLKMDSNNEKFKHKEDIELIKDMLVVRFDKAGELKTDDGEIIDKKVILNCLDKLSPNRLMHLLNCIKDTTTFKPKAIQLLSKLQNVYKMDFEGGFTVQYLQTMQEVTEEFNKRQYRESYVSAAYKCTMCYKGFQYIKAYESHMSTSHDERAMFVCHLCQMRYQNSTLLSKHKHKHRTLCKCKLCHFVTGNRDAMEVHYKKHKGIVVFKCKACPAKFNNRSILYKHQSKCRGSAVVCSSCARKFASPLGLTQHRNRQHRNEVIDSADSVTCDKCHVTFISADVYRRHLVMYKTHNCHALIPKEMKFRLIPQIR